MKISFASYPSLSIIHGGPRVQMLRTKTELETLGAEVTLFDTWNSFDRKGTDLVHLFSANVGTYHIASVFNDYRIPFVTSPIFFTRHSPLSIRTSLAVNRSLKRFRAGIWTNYEFTRQICDWSRLVLPNTTEEGRLIIDGMGMPVSKVSVIPNGVDARFEHSDPSLFKKQYGLDHFILNVGHIGPARKNVLSFIRAVKQIGHPAVIIGQVTRSDYAELCLQEASEAKNILIIKGLDNDSEMLASAYAAARVFALPSLFETPGIAALEAALAGASIVITPHGGTRDYFGDDAEYVDPFSIDSIRNGIERALNTPVNPALRERIKKEFLWPSIAAKTLAAYSSIIP